MKVRLEGSNKLMSVVNKFSPGCSWRLGTLRKMYIRITNLPLHLALAFPFPLQFVAVRITTDFTPADKEGHGKCDRGDS